MHIITLSVTHDHWGQLRLSPQLQKNILWCHTRVMVGLQIYKIEDLYIVEDPEFGEGQQFVKAHAFCRRWFLYGTIPHTFYLAPNYWLRWWERASSRFVTQPRLYTESWFFLNRNWRHPTTIVGWYETKFLYALRRTHNVRCSEAIKTRYTDTQYQSHDRHAFMRAFETLQRILVVACKTLTKLWRVNPLTPIVPYGYSYTASCPRPG